MTWLLTLGWWLTAGWAAWGGLAILIGYFNGFFANLLAILAFEGPLLLLAWLRFKRHDNWKRGFDEFTSAAKLRHSEGRTGIALDTEKRELLLISKDLSKSYPFHDIREWSARAETAGQVFASGSFAAATGALGANIKAQKEANANTGLFVRVRDTEAAEWRISMKRKEDRDRWFEILTQAINEGAAVA